MELFSSGDCLQNCSNNISLLNSSANDGHDNTSLTTEEIILKVLGPKRSSFFLSVTLTYLMIFVTGVAGNVLTCTVIAKHRKMRTPTNLYLFSLAVSDLLVLIFGMPLEIYEMWQNYPFPFGEGGCYFKVFLFETVCFASILNVTALSVERYIAVVHPLKTRYAMTNKHARRVLCGVWSVSLICAIPNTSLHGIYYLHLPEKIPESATCSLLKPLWLYNMVIQITTVLFYFFPMTIISVLYIIMGRHLRKERRLPQERCSSNTSWKIHVESDRRRQVTKMLFVVVLVFAICWAPFHVDRLLWSFITKWTDAMHTIYQYVHILSGVLFYLSSAINPLIYNLLSSRFRERFRELVCSRNPRTSSTSFKSHRRSDTITSTGLVRSVDSAKCSSLTAVSTGCWEAEDENTYM